MASAREKFIRSMFCSLSVGFLISHIAVAQQSSSPGGCDSDGFCTIISVKSEIVQNSPRGSGILVGTVDDDGFKPNANMVAQSARVCKKEVRVPRSVYFAVNAMMESMLTRGAGNGLPTTLTSSEQSILLYYNTIMQQTMNFSCPN
ncbi:hypothetical protein EBU99_07215 [bacterium]|nr:hypothetical protein [bacterium]